jgi:hypothetical protein
MSVNEYPFVGIGFRGIHFLGIVKKTKRSGAWKSQAVRIGAEIPNPLGNVTWSLRKKKGFSFSLSLSFFVCRDLLRNQSLTNCIWFWIMSEKY